MSTPSPGLVRQTPVAPVGAIVVGAGQSRRMGGADKVFSTLRDRPLIAHSLQVMNDSTVIDSIVVVVSADKIERVRRLAAKHGWHKVKDVCAGGARRQDSVRRGLEKLRDTEWVVVHDAARPCLDGQAVARGLEEARQTGAAVAGVPVKDTIKSAGPDMSVTGTLDRGSLWAIQTPQVFDTRLLLEAHRRVTDESTDDAAMVERIGGTVRIFMGSYENVKITTPEDLLVASAILRARLSQG